ncbi:MAG: cupin domain-containing protein [Pseudomonadota bacterium]
MAHAPILPVMIPAVRSAAASEPVLTRERCAIRELHNDPSDPAVSVAEARVEAGVITERHTLSVAERYVITSGEGRMELNGDWSPVRAGDAVLIPAGTPQRIENTGGDPLIFLCVCTPRFTPEAYESLEETA